MIIFTHIPKTAGTSFIRKILRKNCNQMEDRFHKRIAKKKNMADYRKHDCLAGHFAFGIHEKLGLPIEECDYIAFVRDPVARWISAFKWHVGRRRKEKTKSKIGQNKNVDVAAMRRMWKNECNSDIQSFIKQCMKERRNIDMMTVQLAGVEEMLPKYIWYTRPKASDSVMKEQVEIAKHNLEKYKFIGYQKNAEEYFKQFCEQFNFKYHKGDREVRSGASKVKFHDPETLALIEECNQYDMQLFEHIKNTYKEIEVVK